MRKQKRLEFFVFETIKKESKVGKSNNNNSLLSVKGQIAREVSLFPKTDTFLTPLA